MFRLPNAIFMVLHFPFICYSILFCLRFGWVWAIVRSVRPSAAETAYNALEYLLDIFHLIRKMLGTTIKIQR
jgi:hypothetical protein